MLHKLWICLTGIFLKQKTNISKALVEDEVNALIRYATEQSIDQEGNILGPLNKALYAYIQADPSDRVNQSEAVLTLYTRLTALTRPVNGRTLLDTNNPGCIFLWIGLITIILLVCGLGTSMLGDWFANHPEPEEGCLLNLYLIHQHILILLEPFFWGCLGACVYLFKTLSDYLQNRAFDKERLHGWILRIALGGILALVVVRLFDLKELGTIEGANIDAIAVAFLVGLGVKVVYGAFEKMVEVLAEKMNLGTIRRSRGQPSAVPRKTEED